MRESGNINFVLIGAKATGKTVYLASLFLNLKNLTSKNEHTIEYLKPLANILSNKEYPQATSGNLHELMFNYKDEKFVSHIQIDDVDGYFIESMHKTDESTQVQRDTLLRNIKHSEGIVFFFPYQKIFNEESIKNFNYEIDTFISKLKEMYPDRRAIPIPSVIAVSKWDDSPYYEAEDEIQKATEYINDNTFLKFAKEKIELNFSNIKILPISSIGKNFDLNTHNIEKPIKFFLEETYAIWEKKIEKLSDDKEELIKFLSKIYFDMKFYKDGKYTNQYDVLENEFSKYQLLKFEKINSYDEFTKEYETYKNIINALKPDNQKIIADIGTSLKEKQNKKSMIAKTVVIVPLILVLFGAYSWYINVHTKKSQDELLSDISIEFKNKNYKDAMKDIIKYQDKFKGIINKKDKDKIEHIKSEINGIYDKKFTKLKDTISKLNFEDAILKTENDWSDIFLDRKISIKNILNKKFNDKISSDLNSMPTRIDDFDDLINLENKLNNLNIKQEVSFLNEAEKLDLSSKNKSLVNEREMLYKSYIKVLDEGVRVSKITFGAKSEENRPLAFKCDWHNADIVLNINSEIYDYNHGGICIDEEISWTSNQLFKVKVTYSSKAIEEDRASPNDEFDFLFELSPNQLIKISNKKYVQIDIGNSDYYIGVGDR